MVFPMDSNTALMLALQIIKFSLLFAEDLAIVNVQKTTELFSGLRHSST